MIYRCPDLDVSAFVGQYAVCSNGAPNDEIFLGGYGYKTEAELMAILDTQQAGLLEPANLQLTQEDFTLLAGAILGMFVLAFTLKQIRLIINRDK